MRNLHIIIRTYSILYIFDSHFTICSGPSFLGCYFSKHGPENLPCKTLFGIFTGIVYPYLPYVGPSCPFFASPNNLGRQDLSFRINMKLTVLIHLIKFQPFDETVIGNVIRNATIRKSCQKGSPQFESLNTVLSIPLAPP